MKLLVLDGNSIANKAFYGVHSLNAPDGTPTNAIHGFLNMFTRLRNDYNPEAVCVTFDLPGPTFRHKADENYKANRHPMPDDFAIQMPLLKELILNLGINIYELSGFEADDIIGTIAKKSESSGWDCVIATGDRDQFQLLSEKISMCYLGKENVLYSPELFKEQYGFEPINLIDYKAIAGDSSDNYPGVPGIGDKGATELVSLYSTLDNIYDNIENIKPALQKKLKENIESAKHCKWLATIDTDAPIDFSPEDNIWNNDFKPGLYDILKRLGFYKTIEKYKLNTNAVNPADGTPSVNEKLPDGLTLTAHYKDDIRRALDEGKPFISKNVFDTSIAQYLINPVQKNYSEDVSYSYLNSKLDELGLKNVYEKIEMPLCPVLAKIEHKGFLVDKNALVKFGESLTGEIDILESEIYELAGEEFNINSPKQLGDILFDKLHLPAGKKRSTNAEFLEDIKYLHPVVADVLEYRMLTKLKSTYADGLLKVIAPDGRIHTNFQMTVTATGRLSSTEPNLQNIPIRKELGSKIRQMFIAPPGSVLVDADYSQIELRLLAHISNDKNMIEAFKNGSDFHRYTASNVFNIPYENVTPAIRSRAKAVNFGVVYGISAFSLAKDIGVSNAEAKEWMDAYFAEYSGVREYMTNVVEKAKTDGYVSTIYGRRRPMPELASSKYLEREFGKRVALNMPIQGTAADIIKLAMIDVDKKLSELNASIVLQVHDELIVECPENEALEVSAILKESMENVAKLSVPLTAEVNIGSSWSEAH